MEIRAGELNNPQVIRLLQEHHQEMLSLSPPESVHALDLAALEQADITFWSLWLGKELAGIAALKALDHTHGEIKSMRTSKRFLRQGVAAKLVAYVIAQATSRAYTALSLETGTIAEFKPAQQLYQQFGFQPCQPFSDYQPDPHSIFMTKILS